MHYHHCMLLSRLFVAKSDHQLTDLFKMGEIPLDICYEIPV